MRKAISILLTLSAVCILFPCLLTAQITIELPCPVGTNPIFPVGQTFNASTFAYRDWLCFDNNGNVFVQANISTPPAQSLPLTNTLLIIAQSPTTIGTIGNAQGGGGNTGVGTQSNSVNFPTFAAPEWSFNHSQSAACTATCIGDICCQNGNNVVIDQLLISRYESKIALNTLQANTRYWVGLAAFSSTSTLGLNATAIGATTRYQQALPNATTIAFRFSRADGDTTWKVVIIQAGTSSIAASKVIDTGIAGDNGTTPHIFDIIPSIDFSQLSFFMDGRLVASSCYQCVINLTTLPTLFDRLVGVFYLGDNNNTAANTVSSIMWYVLVLFRS